MRQDQTYEELSDYAAELEARVRSLEHKLEKHEKTSEQLRAKFLSNISHEIRTPMNAILGFSSLLNDQQLTCNKREEYMDHINQSSARLLHIVEDMIDVSLIETGQLQVRHDECHIDKLLQDIYHYFNVHRHRKGKNNIALLLNTSSKGDGFTILTDQFRLRQVISNLLTNALKFTEKGIIEFGYHFDDDKNMITFYVTDSGQGVLQEQSRIIFDSFQKTDHRNDEKFDSGVGLGLTLSKGIIKLLGGKIWVESNVFKGSTFRFSIPCRVSGELGATSIHTFANSKLFIA